MGTVEAITPHYLLVAIVTLAGTTLAYAAIDSVCSLPPLYNSALYSCMCVQGQLEVNPGTFSLVRVGQKVVTAVHSPASMEGGKQRGPPIVVVTSTRVSGSREGQKDLSKPSYMEVQPGDIISVM